MKAVWIIAVLLAVLVVISSLVLYQLVLSNVAVRLVDECVDTEDLLAPPDVDHEVDVCEADRVISDEERSRMQDYIAQHVRPQDVVHNFTAPSGDEIDCVGLNSQPALRRPGMEDHVVQFEPQSLGPLNMTPPPTNFAEHDDGPFLEQGFTSDGESCPVASVPIQRLTMDTLQRFETLEAFFSMKNAPHLLTGPTDLHQYAAADRSVANWGAESVLNVWKPYTERSDEFTLSQIWVSRGNGSNLETVEGGWQKYRDLYGDWRSRLFIYFTPDNYGSGGCYNLSCGAFVQVSSSVYIGGGFTSYSSHGGTQYIFKLLWYKDGTSGHWWLRYQNTWVGYYPRSLFDSSGLRDQGDRVVFGGEITDTQPGGRHTRTDMGSGYMPSFGWRWAAYQRSVRYVDTSNFYRQATSLTAIVTDSNCYDISLRSSSGSWEQYFYFGGWGFSSHCQ